MNHAIQPKKHRNRRLPFGVAALTAILALSFSLAALSLISRGSLRSGAWFTDAGQIQAKILTGDWPTPTPEPQQGTSIEVRLTAEGFTEELDGGSANGVYGEICVENTGEAATEGLEIAAAIQTKSGGGEFTDLVEELIDLGSVQILDPGAEVCYPYEITFEPVPDERAHYRLRVSSTILNHSGWLPGSQHCPGTDACPFGPEVKEGFDLPEGEIEPEALQPTPELTPSATLDLFPTPAPDNPPIETLEPTPLPTEMPTEVPTPEPTSTEAPPAEPTPAP